MPALRFKTCRLLEGNVWNRELQIIQRRILRRLRNKKRSIKRKISSRKNLNSYIQSQTTRKLPLFHGDLPITEMHRGTERTSYIPFPLNPETRSDVIPVRLHFCETIPQARQPISHRRVCVNQVIVCITHLKVSHGDIISFQENDARTRGEEIRRFFYIEISVEKRIGKFRNRPVRMWRRTKTEWFRLLKTKRGCRRLLKSRFLQQLRSSMQEEDLEKTKKFGSEKVCLGSSFAKHNRMKRNYLYHFKFGSLVSSFGEYNNRMKRNFSLKFRFLSKRRNKKKRDIPNSYISRNKKKRDIPNSYISILSSILSILERNPRVVNSSLYSNSTYCSASPQKFTRKRKRIELPTHYSEVNHRTPKAVVSYGPNIGHIPHDIRLKDPNLLLRSGNGRGQNI